QEWVVLKGALGSPVADAHRPIRKLRSSPPNVVTPRPWIDRQCIPSAADSDGLGRTSMCRRYRWPTAAERPPLQPHRRVAARPTRHPDTVAFTSSDPSAVCIPSTSYTNGIVGHLSAFDIGGP
ncbi:hypothetical protein THAOC_34507, partial [Thalassiosira oceanica]